MTLRAYADGACTHFLQDIPTATLTTDRHGNGHAAVLQRLGTGRVLRRCELR